jgi:hypothetical protein
VWSGRGEQVRSWYGKSVTTAGDVNGDGFADILVGSPKYTDTKTEEGRVQLYCGGGGCGVSLRPRQMDNDGSPLAHLGTANSMDYYQVHMRNRSPFGRSRMKLEIEDKPYGMLFDGNGIWGGSFFNLFPGADMNVSPAFDYVAGAQYHWRVRWSYTATTNPFLPHSRWLHMPYHGWNEPDLRGGGFSLFLPLLIN